MKRVALVLGFAVVAASLVAVPLAQQKGKPKFNTWRVTFTRPVINQAECVLLMVCGKDKAQPFSEVIGQGSPDVYPVKYVQPTHGELIWLVDRAAAATLAPATK